MQSEAKFEKRMRFAAKTTGLTGVVSKEIVRLLKSVYHMYSTTHNIISYSGSKGICTLYSNGIKQPLFEGVKESDMLRFEQDKFFKQLSELQEYALKNQIVKMLQLVERWVPMGPDPFDREENPKPTLFILVDIINTLKAQPVVVTAMKELADSIVAEWSTNMKEDAKLFTSGEVRVIPQRCKTTVLLISSAKDYPTELLDYISFVEFPLPTEEDLKARAEFAFSEMHAGDESIPAKPFGWIWKKGLGLTYEQFDRVMLAADEAWENNHLENTFKKAFIEGKTMELRSTGILGYTDVDQVDEVEIGGCAGLKRLADELDMAMSDERAGQYGVVAKENILLLGAPGTGKSSFAKMLMKKLRVAMLKFETSKIFDKWVGGSEQKLEEALAQIEANGAVLVFIDEIEKLLGETAGGTHEVTARIKGRFLNWLQENKSRAIIVATCNSIHTMSPELIRRFTHLVFVDLPTDEELHEIISIHIEKKRTEESVQRSIENFNMPLLVKAFKGYTGAEVESCIVKAIRTAFVSGAEDVTTEFIEMQAALTTPISVRQKTLVDDLRRYGFEYCLLANDSEEQRARQAKAREKIKEARKVETHTERSKFSDRN